MIDRPTLAPLEAALAHPVRMHVRMHVRTQSACMSVLAQNPTSLTPLDFLPPAPSLPAPQRRELPTDDPHYEARKEREAEEAEERRGAANAIRGGEYMYM